MKAWDFEVQKMALTQAGMTLQMRVNEAIARAALQIEANAKLAIQNPPKTGRLYRRAGGRMHQASAPGEAPATDTGNLVNSGQTTRLGFADYAVSFSTPYAAALEFGTHNMAARPFLMPAVMKVASRLQEDISRAMSR